MRISDERGELKLGEICLLLLEVDRFRIILSRVRLSSLFKNGTIQMKKKKDYIRIIFFNELTDNLGMIYRSTNIFIRFVMLCSMYKVLL